MADFGGRAAGDPRACVEDDDVIVGHCYVERRMTPLNLYLETASSGTPTVGTPGQNGLGQLNQGYLETSNVNVVEELVNMIETQRAYEINSKAISAADQMLKFINTNM